ncbi:MAG: polymer-forming cytoskeletal protein [Phycisphaerales bacterium]|nr:polymer-forming cytoskeletal protein [Phycisphaerales bacterium]
MAKQKGPRPVRCYHCGRTFEVPAKAMTCSCPGCFKGIQLESIVVKNMEQMSRLETCGSITVRKRGLVQADRIIAADGIVVEGIVHANAKSGRCVTLHSGAQWKGDLTAPSLEIREGASILGGFFRIGPGEVEPPPERVAIGATSDAQSPAGSTTPRHSPKPTRRKPSRSQ